MSSVYYEGSIEEMDEKDLVRLSETRLRSMDREEVSELLERYEDKIIGKQKEIIAEVVEKLLALEDDDDEDEGFVLEPGNPNSPKSRARSSIDESVWCAPTPRGSSSIQTSREDITSPVISEYSESNGERTIQLEGSYYAETEYEPSVFYDDDTCTNSIYGGGDNCSMCESSATSPIRSSRNRSISNEFYNEPRKIHASVENIDTECTAKRRAKAADDAREFGRALKWVYNVLKLEPLPIDIESRPEDCFGEQLCDGVLLCSLLNVIKPGTVRKVTKRTTIPFHMMANITSFVRGCQALGVKKRDCFDTLDLQTHRDLSKVYETLLMLNRAVQKTCPEYKGPFLFSAKQIERMQARSKRKSGRNHPSGLQSAPCTPLVQNNPKVFSRAFSGPTRISESLPASPASGRIPSPPPISTKINKQIPCLAAKVTLDQDDDPTTTISRQRTKPIELRCTSPKSEISSVTVSTNHDQQQENLPTATIDQLVKQVGLEKYAAKIADIADDINDLKEMTEEDFQDFVNETKMPPLKARRLKKALIDLGAALHPPNTGGTVPAR
mmetsp:Transcript_17179/g.22331  ORF Transcript_17179/g.22331 Transcript_17179/m.22331 type:complete len:555 (+) Transcript_17179:74-1738(+)